MNPILILWGVCVLTLVGIPISCFVYKPISFEDLDARAFIMLVASLTMFISGILV